MKMIEHEPIMFKNDCTHTRCTLYALYRLTVNPSKGVS
jgi:hypothetical protein